MTGSVRVRCYNAAARLAHRIPGMSSLRRWAVAVVASAVMIGGAPAALSAGPAQGQRSGSGAGATVEYQTSSVLEGRSITATVRVFVVVPKARTQPTYLAVGVKESDDETGAELFSGTGTAAPGSFTVGAHFAGARVTGQVTVLSATPDVTRIADVDVVWSPEAATKRIRIRPRHGGAGEASTDRHRGRVRRMTGVGLVRISDPTRIDHVFMITTPGLGAAWKTRDTSRDLVEEPTKRPGSNASGTEGIAASTAGYWTGYWTWKWNGTTWVAYWTWVYHSGSGSYSVS